MLLGREKRSIVVEPEPVEVAPAHLTGEAVAMPNPEPPDQVPVRRPGGRRQPEAGQ